MDEGIGILFIIIIFIVCIFGAGFVVGIDGKYDNYMDGVNDASDFYKFYNDTSKDIDIDFWVGYAIDKYPTRYYDFKEKYMRSK